VQQVLWRSVPGGWRESEHPRHPADTPGSRGGQFREKGPSAGSERWVQAALGGIGIDLDGDRLFDVVTRGREVARTPLHGGSIGQTSIVTFEMPDGQHVPVVHKRQDPEYSDLEVWSSRVGRAIGAPVAAVIHDPSDEDSIYLPFIEGHAAIHRAQSIAEENDDDVYAVLEDLVRDHSSGRRGALLGLLDIALLNEDRHGGNWMIDAEDNAWGIDHTHIAPWSNTDYEGYEDFGAMVRAGESDLNPNDIYDAIDQVRRLAGTNRIPDEWLPPMIARLERLRDDLAQRKAEDDYYGPMPSFTDADA